MLCAAVGALFVAVGWAIFDADLETYFLSVRFGWDCLIFTVTSIIFMLFLPKLLENLKSDGGVVGLDAAIGEEFEVESRSKNLVIIFQGQAWNLLDAKKFKLGNKVKVLAFEGSKVKVELV